MTGSNDCFVSVVAPVYNNADILQEFIHVTLHTLQRHYANYELILVDDGSSDQSMEVIAEALADYDCIHVLRMPRSFGEDVAIAAGLEAAIGDYVLLMLPYSDPPELIPLAIARARAGDDVVVGVLANPAYRLPLIHLGKAFLTWYCRAVCRIEIPRHHTKLRVLSRRALNTLLQLHGQPRALRYNCLTLGYRTGYFAYDPIWRHHDMHVHSLPGFLRLLLDLAVATSRHPLRLMTWTGGMASLLTALYSLYIVGMFLWRHKTAEGWTTLSLEVSVLFFFVFLILMVACEYLGQILFESHQRPLYYLLEERNSSVMLADRSRRNLTSDSDQPPLP